MPSIHQTLARLLRIPVNHVSIEGQLELPPNPSGLGTAIQAVVSRGGRPDLAWSA